MKSHRVIAATVLLFAFQACSREPTLSRAAYGDVVFGTRLEAVEADLQEQAKPEFFDEFCMFVTFSANPRARFKVEQGTVTRVDVDQNAPNTLDVVVGQPASKVEDQYPNVGISPHKYDPKGEYLTFPAEDSKSAIVMEVSDGRVTTIRAGLEPAVHYVEGCR